MTAYIKSLGYPARPHSPNTGYDLLAPPIAVDAGLGEQGRFGITMYPEFGGAARPAVITTNLPLIPDKPISMGLKEFCQKCKICADQCPSGAISKADGPELQPEGMVRWRPDIDKCFEFYSSVPYRHACGICIAACPWARKNNWLHNASRQIAVRDRTGIMHSAMLWSQKFIWPYPDVNGYHAPTRQILRERPWYLRAEDIFKGVSGKVFKV